MYWIGPGRYTAERNRAFAIYITVGLAAVAGTVALSYATTGGLTVAGLTSTLWMVGLIGAIAGYSYYTRWARNNAAARQAGLPQGVVARPNVLHAVYQPVAPPVGYAAQPAYPVAPAYPPQYPVASAYPPQYPIAPTADVPTAAYPTPPGASPVHSGYAAGPVAVQPTPMTPSPAPPVPPPGTVEHVVLDHEPLPPTQ